MKFKATKEQVQKLAVNAIEASSPFGMGLLHFNPNTKFNPQDIKVTDEGVNLDYVEGRMVKLYISKEEGSKDIYEIRDNARSDYQSWVAKYPTVKDLVSSVSDIVIQ